MREWRERVRDWTACGSYNEISRDEQHSSCKTQLGPALLCLQDSSVAAVLRWCVCMWGCVCSHARDLSTVINSGADHFWRLTVASTQTWFPSLCFNANVFSCLALLWLWIYVLMVVLFAGSQITFHIQRKLQAGTSPSTMPGALIWTAVVPKPKLAQRRRKCSRVQNNCCKPIKTEDSFRPWFDVFHGLMFIMIETDKLTTGQLSDKVVRSTAFRMTIIIT